MQSIYKTSRAFRNTASKVSFPFHASNPRNFVKILPSPFRKIPPGAFRNTASKGSFPFHASTPSSFVKIPPGPFRNTVLKGSFPFHASTPSNFAKIPPGEYGSKEVKINIASDGTITIPPNAYSADVVAFIAATINGHPGIDASTKERLHRFVEALKIHGYGESSEERD